MKKLIISISIFIVLGLFISICISTATNCGGNSVALSVVNSYTIEIIGEDNNTLTAYDLLNGDLKTKVNSVLHNSWLRGMEYWVINKSVKFDDKVPVIICCKMYSNVPKPSLLNFYRGNLQHAVGLSNGTTELWNEEIYKGFNFENYKKIKL